MKSFNIKTTSGALVTALVLLAACTKKSGKEVATETTSFGNIARVQVYNASIPNAATDARRNYLYINSAPVTGQSLTYGTAFPASSTAFGVTAGYSAFLIRDTAVGSIQPQISFAENLQAGNSYTIFLYDTFTTIKQKTVVTDIRIPDDTSARVRFANFAYSPAASAGIDIYSTRRAANVATNLMFTDVTGFIPYASNLSDSLIVSDNATPSLKLDTLIFNPTIKRSYTLVFRGRRGVNETLLAPAYTASSPNPRVLAVFPNN